jgi:hypothetical protein
MAATPWEEKSTVEEHDVAWNALDGLDEKGRQVGVLAFLARLGLVNTQFSKCVYAVCRVACAVVSHLFDELEKLGYLLLTPLDGGQRVVVVVDVPRVELKKGFTRAISPKRVSCVCVVCVSGVCRVCRVRRGRRRL